MVEVAVKIPNTITGGTIYASGRNHVPNYIWDTDTGVPLHQSTSNGGIGIIRNLKKCEQ